MMTLADFLTVLVRTRPILAVLTDWPGGKGLVGLAGWWLKRSVVRIERLPKIGQSEVGRSVLALGLSVVLCVEVVHVQIT
jgi:hypothetical protein